MTKFKKLMAIAAVSMLGIQMLGTGAALAAKGGIPGAPGGGGAASGVDAECDFGSNELEITLGYDSTPSGTGGEDAEIWVDADGILYCDAPVDPDSAPADSIDSITVVMDDDDSNGSLYIYLDDDAQGSQSAAEWPEFETFDIDVTTKVYVDGSAVDGTSGRASLRVVVGAKSLNFSGTTATSNAPSYEIKGAGAADTLDGSKTAARLTVYGNGGNDLIKGGSANDALYGDGGADVLYGNGGNDDLDCGSAETGTQGWGGDGLDDIQDCVTAAPGAGDDVVDADATRISYADLTDGIEWTNIDGAFGAIETGGAAGMDTFGIEPSRVYGGAGDDLIADDNAAIVSGGAGDDFLKVNVGLYADGSYASGGAGDDLMVGFDYGTDSSFFGNAGNDVLRGKDGNDMLRGGPGNDQSWGGSGNQDFCAAEVTNRCELGRV